MRIADFDLYQALLLEKSGLSLSADKSYLLDSRLTPIARKWGYPSLEAMTVAMRGVPEPDLVKDIIEAMTTNETSFFRDAKPFEIFKETVMPYIAENRKKQKTLRIWCAASSTGQEPYSLAITILENKDLLPGWNISITATDISDEVIESAKKGLYSQFEVQRGMPVQLLMKYFDAAEDKWQLRDEVRNMVSFKNFNLLDNMDALGTYDVILCRNVLIYFDDPTKSAVLAKISKKLASDGFLFLGGSETVLGTSEDFKPMDGCRGLYVLVTGEHGADSLAKAVS